MSKILKGRLLAGNASTLPMQISSINRGWKPVAETEAQANARYNTRVVEIANDPIKGLEFPDGTDAA